MPNIKPEERQKTDIILSTKTAEYALVTSAGAVFCSGATAIYTAAVLYVSNLIYPFTAPYFPLMPHDYLPLKITSFPPFVAAFLGGLATPLLYYAEKHIFFRQIPLIIRSTIISLAVNLVIVLCSLISHIFDFWGWTSITLIIPVAEPDIIPWLLLLLIFISALLLRLCDAIRRYVFHLP